jgi:Domain of unknown function (DUF4338)
MTLDDRASELRRKVLDEIALVQDRLALAANLGPNEAKEQLRLAHWPQRKVRLEEAAEFLSMNESRLIEQFANGDEVDPSRISPRIIPVRTPQEADLFKFASLQWSVPVSSGYGRRSRFLVRDTNNGKLMAIFALGDPVIAQAARDEVIGWSVAQRNERLYSVYDAFVLGAMEPYRQLLGGKLVALLTLANETRAFLTRKYAGIKTEIRKVVKDPTPVLITTTSALGKSSVYNRLTFRGTKMFHSVGYTRGFGHFQFSEELFSALRSYLEVRAEEEGNESRAQSHVYGEGPNWRFRVIRNALELLGIDEELLQHNLRREVFLAPLASNWDDYLRGEAHVLEQFDLPADELASYWRDRWAIPRAERRAHFRHWNREEGRMTPLLDSGSVQLVFGSSRQALPGRVEMGSFHLSVGVESRRVTGTTMTDASSTGNAYISKLEGPGVEVSLADIEWNTGEREVRGWSRHHSDEILKQVIGRLRIGVHRADRYRGMSMLELRVAAGSEGKRATARKTSPLELSEALGFDIAAGLDGIGEAVVGTREELLRDEGPRRNQLCVVFRSDNRLLPALAWCLVRAMPLIHQQASGMTARVSAPVVLRPAPQLVHPEGDNAPAHAI